MDEIIVEKQKTKWDASKILLFILAIILSVQVTPMVGYFLNIFIIVPVAGMGVAIAALVMAIKQKRMVAGPILAILGYLIVLIRMGFFYANLGHNTFDSIYGDFSNTREIMNSPIVGILMSGIVLDWPILIGATVCSYIGAFKKRKVKDNQNYNAFK